MARLNQQLNGVVCNDNLTKIRLARLGKKIAALVSLDWLCFYLCVPDREEMKRDTASQQRRRSESAVSHQSTGPPHTTSPASYLYMSTNTHTGKIIYQFIGHEYSIYIALGKSTTYAAVS